MEKTKEELKTEKQYNLVDKFMMLFAGVLLGSAIHDGTYFLYWAIGKTVVASFIVLFALKKSD